MPCFHYRATGHPDEVRDHFHRVRLYCPRCNFDISIPVEKLNCPKCEEYLISQIEFWKERYAHLLASLNTEISQIEQKTFVNPQMELYHERLIALVNKFKQKHETGEV